MRIAILASEGAPYIKSGGLGDVMEALPSALARIAGNEVVLLLPYYKKILENPAFETELVTQFHVALGWRQQYAGIHRLKNRSDGVQVYFIDNLFILAAVMAVSTVTEMTVSALPTSPKLAWTHWLHWTLSPM